MKCFIFLYTALCTSLVAAPEGFHLVQGDAKPPVLDGAGNLVIESGKQAVIQWDSFSIAQQEAVRFVQQDAKSAVLNRVTGLSESYIDGLLLSNGQVFLVNPNGILIGPNGQIITAGFIGSTLDLVDEDFLKGASFTFQNHRNQSIVNLGKIEATEGNVFLLASRIQNQGTLSAKQGTVGLGVGNEILLQPQGKNNMFIKYKINSPVDSDALIDQSGWIQAVNTELKSGTNPYVKAIRVTGSIESHSIQEEGGRVYLLAEGGETNIQGTIAARSGSKGGQIHLLGEQVNLCANAIIDASGEHGGGEVLIGGDFGGKNPDIPNAQSTFLASHAKVLAKATEEGDGGKISFWADQRLDVYGEINVEAGLIAGNGGEIEISSAGVLTMKGRVKQGALHGKPGKTLYDPVNITISTDPDSNITNPSGAGTYTFPPGCASTTSNIDSASLETNLASGDVIINTSASGGAACGGAGNIDITSAVLWNSSGGLTLIADGGITLTDFSVINSGSGAISLQTNGGDLTITDGGFETDGGISLSITGNVSASTSLINFVGCGLQSQGISGTISGNLTLSSTGNQSGVLIGGRPSVASSGVINLTVGGGITISCTNTASDAGIGYGVATPAFARPATSVSNGNITVTTTGGNIALSGAGTTRIGHYSSSTVQSAVTVQSSGSISLANSGSGTPQATLGALTNSGFSGSNPMLVIANNSITVSTTGSGLAKIQNLDTSSTLTLVCDNANSTSYNSSSTAGLVFTGTGAQLQLSSTVQQLKLYSVDSTLNTLPSTIATAAYPPPAGQESLYQQSAVLYPGGTYGGQAYMNFYKIGYAPPSPPAPTPTPTPIVVDPIQTTTVSSTTAIANILTPPTNTNDTSSVIQGPAAQTDQNPNDSINQNPSYNNDYRTTESCI